MKQIGILGYGGAIEIRNYIKDEQDVRSGREKRRERRKRIRKNKQSWKN